MPRCGHSSAVYGGRLWVVGGGSGRDLLRRWAWWGQGEARFEQHNVGGGHLVRQQLRPLPTRWSEPPPPPPPTPVLSDHHCCLPALCSGRDLDDAYTLDLQTLVGVAALLAPAHRYERSCTCPLGMCPAHCTGSPGRRPQQRALPCACNLPSQEWSRVALPPGPACAGKCHSACLVGCRLLLFGGSMPTCSDLAWLDLEARRWGAPATVLGREPAPRMSGVVALAGEEVLLFGGFTFGAREVGRARGGRRGAGGGRRGARGALLEWGPRAATWHLEHGFVNLLLRNPFPAQVGDLHRLRLVVDREEEEREAAAAGAARAAAGRAMRRWRSLWV